MPALAVNPLSTGTIDPTQPTNTNPTSGSFTFGNLGSWIIAATNGAGTVLGALNNKSPSSPAAQTSTSTFPKWIWYAAGGLALLAVILIGFGHRK